MHKSKKKKIKIFRRILLTFIALMLVATGALLGYQYLSNPSVTLAYEFDRNLPMLKLSEGNNSDIADSYADDLCVTTENILLSGVSMEEDASAALFDIQNQNVLYSKDLFIKRYPASLTKVMTAYLALKYGDLTDMVTVSETAMNIDTDSSVCYLEAGDTVSLDDLVKGLLIQSGNDAANAIAEHIGDGDPSSGNHSIESFVNLMNQEAVKMGATSTHFVNPHGLQDENHYTTAYDVYLMFNEVMKNDHFVEILNETHYTATVKHADGTSGELSWIATNEYHTMESTPPKDVTVIGGKTGTTKAAGNCLVLLSQDAYGNPYISIIMNSEQKSTLYEEMNQ
ncbi:MAG TPA: D-alanyl-D-alanine carboxypeptidase, partial [Candidatus Merdenecus merdavium]|nr:D-alanyl-D-alanine carboxypeptidase [Candidatus Merdenecus merdavium]